MSPDTSTTVTRRRALRAGALLCTAGVAGCTLARETVTRTTERTFRPDGATALTVSTRNGDVSLSAGDGEAVTGTVTKRTRSGEDALGKVTVTSTTGDGTLAVGTEREDLAPNASVSVDFDLAVPPSLAVTAARSENGDVTASGVTGDGTYHTTNGDVDVADVDGYVAVTSTNGDVTARRPSGLTAARSTNGHVDVDVPAVREDVLCRTVNGDVTAAVPADLDARVALRTDNGDATVGDVALDVSTSSGGRVRGTLDDGGPLLECRTTNGDVRLARL